MYITGVVLVCAANNKIPTFWPHSMYCRLQKRNKNDTLAVASMNHAFLSLTHAIYSFVVMRLYVCIRPCRTNSTIFNIRIHSCTDIITYLNKNEWIMAEWKALHFMDLMCSSWLCFCVCPSACFAIRHHTSLATFSHFRNFSFFFHFREHTRKNTFSLSLFITLFFCTFDYFFAFVHILLLFPFHFDIIHADFMLHIRRFEVKLCILFKRTAKPLHITIQSAKKEQLLNYGHWIGTDMHSHSHTHTNYSNAHSIYPLVILLII